MRKLLLAITTAAAVLLVGSFTADRANAMTVGSASGVRAAIEDVSAMLEVPYVCRHRWSTSGRRCWWVPGERRYRYWRYRRWR